ncbi:OmpH family outer membrane protein [Pelagovum pacificum]|uniref:OmpH family outer membrane protein n=1 Tax=Pelagovum pacificum TaxID=2588711 RepID=A0A5C5GEG9_9RHOB|nr:OmpH family outer membrane protein [Pelagovum pacificum]QQA44544.1 OmpH family outer membrane protein [Pelagovum pacificum]TNY32341.1 OmpH family outer membrane protein [Pelagovum pacificum]
MRLVATLAVALLLATGAAAQDDDPIITVEPPVQQPEPGQGSVVRSPVLTIDPEQMFSQSLYGQRMADELQAETEALAAENRRITEELETEERALTERRRTMSPEDFRAEAEAFDERVQEIRRTQDAKERALGQTLQEGQDQFLLAIRPLLGQLMAARGAAVILDRRDVILGVGAIDVTAEAVQLIDSELGTGEEAPVAEE